nr:hypothetical protein [Tanacetum cinerariifolium]
MAISIISVSSDSLKESVGTSTGRVILFGTIPATIPDTTPPRSPTASGVVRLRVMILTPGQPIPHGRPYHYQPNRLVHMMTAGKRVGPLHTHRLAVRHSVDYSSLDLFSSDDSSRNSSLSSSSSLSSETSSDPSLDDLSDSSSDHSLLAPSTVMTPSHRLCSLVPSVPCLYAAIIDRTSHSSSSSASPSRKRSRSPAASIPLSPLVPEALSSARADLLPSPKRIRSLESGKDLEGCSEDSEGYCNLTHKEDSLRQILHPNTLETIIQSSSNIIERPIAEFVQFINPHQPVKLVFILIDESSWIGIRDVRFLALKIEMILEVVVDEVIKMDNTTTSGVRLLPKRIRALLDSCMTLSSAH